MIRIFTGSNGYVNFNGTYYKIYGTNGVRKKTTKDYKEIINGFPLGRNAYGAILTVAWPREGRLRIFPSMVPRTGWQITPSTLLRSYEMRGGLKRITFEFNPLINTRYIIKVDEKRFDNRKTWPLLRVKRCLCI